MSIETWKEEFLPIPANLVETKDAILHSLHKWEGLTKGNRDRHRLRWKEVISVTGEDTCALCLQFLKNSCIDCPIYKAGQRCGVANSNAYSIFREVENPYPMIKLLQSLQMDQMMKELPTWERLWRYMRHPALQDRWIPTTQIMYEAMLNCVPPAIIKPFGFACGEESHEGLHACFIQEDGCYFAQYMKPSDFAKL